MNINFESILTVEFLNEIERNLGSFHPTFIKSASDLCLPLLPNEFFSIENHKELLTEYLVDFFGDDYS
ncbi:TPA: hypothetical protein ACX6RX_003166 [Photobacterium damselae]